MQLNKLNKKAIRKIMAFLITVTMLIPTVAVIPVSAALPTQTAGTQTLAQGNIARDTNVTVTADYSNGTNGDEATQLARVRNGAVPTASQTSPGYSWNTWNTSTNPINITYSWPYPVTIDATRVMWWRDTGGVGNPPSACVIQYNSGTPSAPVWTSVQNLKGFDGAETNSIGFTVNTAPNTTWNGVSFDPVTTTEIRLRLSKSSSTWVGISEWEVYGTLGDPELISVGLAGPGSIFLGSEATYTATVASPGLTGVAYRWTLSNANASFVGDITGSAVTVKADALGDVRLSLTVTHDTGVREASAFADITVNPVPIRSVEDYITGTAAGNAPILPNRVVVKNLRFDTPSAEITNNGYSFYETFEDSLVPVEWDLASFTAADYAADNIGTSFEVTGMTKADSRAPGLAAKAVVTVNTPLAAPDYNHSVTSEHVTFTDSFWTPKQQVNATSSFDAAFTELGRTSGNWQEEQNFRNAITRLNQVAAGNDNPPIQGHAGYVFSDTDIYKTLEAVSYNMAAIWDDPAMAQRRVELQAKLETWIGMIEAIQYADGYINTCFSARATATSGSDGRATGNVRWRDMSRHEMYNIGHFLESAVAYTRFREGVGQPDYRLYEVGKRAADHIVNVFGPDGYRHEVPGHQEIELALMKMAILVEEYEGVATGQKYRDTVEVLVDRRGEPNRGTVRESGYNAGNYSQDARLLSVETEAVGHAVRAMYFYTGVTDAAIAMSDDNPKKEVYLSAMNRIFGQVTERNTYITGGIGGPGGNEGFGTPWGLANTTSYCEICAGIAMANWLQRLNLEYEDAKYVDAYERALYNAVLVGVNLGGGLFYYSTPLQGSRSRHAWESVACCESNVLRTIANMSGYMYTVNKDNVFVNMYGGSNGNVNVEGTNVRFDQVTEYPWEGDIKMTVAPETAKMFTINIRIPGWLKAQKHQQVTIQIGDEIIDSTPNEKGYVPITREWPAEGTEIRINIPMEVRLTEPDNNVHNVEGAHSNRDRVAIERGPIVYCLEDAGTGTTTGNTVNATAAVFDRNSDFTPVRRPDLLRDVVALNGTATFNGITRNVTLTPYYAWNNRGSDPANLGNGTTNTGSRLIIWTTTTGANVQIRGDKNKINNGDTATLMAVPKVNYSAAADQIPTDYVWTVSGAGVLAGDPTVAQAPTSGYEKIGGLLLRDGGSSIAQNTVEYFAGTAKIKATQDEGFIIAGVQAKNGDAVLYTDNYIIIVGDYDGALPTDFLDLINTVSAAKTKDAALYTAESYAAMQTAVTAAEAFLDANLENPDITKEAIDAETAKLVAAIDALVPVADFKALTAGITAAEAIDGMLYTPTSFAPLAAALADAKAFIAENGGNELTPQALIDEHAAIVTAAIAGLKQLGASSERTNIALAPNATAIAEYTNGYCLSANPPGGAYRINDGGANGDLSSTSWNSYGSGGAYPYPNVKVWLEWESPVVVDSMRVLWAYDGGSGGGVQLPSNCTVQYLDENGNYVNVANMRSGLTGDGDAVTSVGVLGSGTSGANNIWNGVTFDQVKTTRLQLTITQRRTSGTSSAGGAGIYEWEVFGKEAATNITTDNRIIVEPTAMPTGASDVFNPEFAVTAKEDMVVQVIAAAYDNVSRKLVDYDRQTAALTAYVPVLQLCPSIEIVEGRTYRFFIWDGNGVPLTVITSLDGLE